MKFDINYQEISSFDLLVDNPFLFKEIKLYSIIMISTYSTITFENKKIIIIIDNNKQIWFNAKQISSALKYKQLKMAI